MVALQRAQAGGLHQIIRDIPGPRQGQRKTPDAFRMRLHRAANGLFGTIFSTHRINCDLCVFDCHGPGPRGQD